MIGFQFKINIKIKEIEKFLFVSIQHSGLRRLYGDLVEDT